MDNIANAWPCRHRHDQQRRIHFKEPYYCLTQRQPSLNHLNPAALSDLNSLFLLLSFHLATSHQMQASHHQD